MIFRGLLFEHNAEIGRKDHKSTESLIYRKDSARLKILYYDCFSGISGDMNLGALIDLGVDPSYLTEELKKLPLEGYELKVGKAARKGITGTRVDVLTGTAEHAHRSFKVIRDLITESGLSDAARERSLDIFLHLARAEAGIHGVAIDEVHFHEVGAVDSIIDIVGAAICLEYLAVDAVWASPVEVGGGFVTCAHGTYPVPAPATTELLKGVPITTGAVPFETTTPTGAAILASMVAKFSDRLNFTLLKTGYGIGSRDTEIPNVLRVMLGEEETSAAWDCDRETALLMECNIDDMNPELHDYIMEALFDAGAQDVFLTPIVMKKSRPAVILSVLCGIDEAAAISEILLAETTTFGIRTGRVEKTMLKREVSWATTPYGDVRIKHAYFKGKKIKSKPEYDDCRELARKQGVSIREIYKSIDES